jgi:hypothetical protein
VSMRWMVVWVVVWLLAGLGLAGDAQAALPGGISGAWYNPAQSGHGLSVELIARDRAVLFWYVYDPQGNPIFLYIEGAVTGRRIDGVAYAPKGMRFGTFDPAAVTRPVWGNVSLDFSDCSHATLNWNAVGAEYGTGRMPLQRLTGVVDLPCALPPASTLATGLYEGTVETTNGIRSTAWGIVDGEGVLWGIERWNQFNSLIDPGMIPGPYFVGAYPSVFRATPTQAAAGAVDARMRTMTMSWLRPQISVAVGTGTWNLAGAYSARFDSVDTAPPNLTAAVQHWRQGAAVGVELVSPVSLTELSGTHRIDYFNQFFERRGEMTVSEGGALCLKLDSSDCEHIGTLSTPEGALGVIDFEMRSVVDPNLATYRGRGWLARANGERVLVLTGDNGSIGFGLIGRRPQ